mgnify:FL=1
MNRSWGMSHCVPRKELERISKSNVDNDYEVADELGIQVDYLHTVGLMYGLRYKSID